MSARLSRTAAALVALLACACTVQAGFLVPEASDSSAAPTQITDLPAGDLALASVAAAAAEQQQQQQQQQQQYLVTFKVTPEDVQQAASSMLTMAAASADGAAPSAADAEIAAAAAVKTRVLAPAAAPGGVSLDADFSSLPVSLVTVGSDDALKALQAHGDVLSVEPNRRNRRQTMQSFGVINQPSVISSGLRGDGCAVAVLDTGADYTKPDLGSCAYAGAPAPCRVVYAQDFTTNDDGKPDADKWTHGTNVASIIAKMAPGVKILALDVFENQGTDSWAWDSDILKAIDWVVSAKKAGTYNVCSINLSLGSEDYWTSPCGNGAYERAFKAARDAGIATAIAAGNENKKDRISSPACAPSAISVGAVYDSDLGSKAWTSCSEPVTSADRVTCFSNSASYLTLLAPGSDITAGGVTLAGTSQASPHVAAAIALLKAAKPAATVDQIVAALASTGKRVTDAANGVTTPRIDVAAAAAALTGLVLQPAADTQAPTGTVKINGGAASTASLDVTLAITATDASGVASMCIANGLVSAGSCKAFEPFAASKAWRLVDSGNGVRIVSVYLRDTVGNTMTAPIQATITLAATTPVVNAPDTTPPTGTVKINSGAATTKSLDVALAITGADAVGVETMCITNQAGATAASCWPFESFAASKAWRLAEGGNGARTVSVFLRDAARNVMQAPATATIAYAPSTSVLSINGGAAVTSSRTLKLAISAAGANARTTKMCIGIDVTEAGCTRWSTFAAAKTYTLQRSQQGRLTVRAFFRDAAAAIPPAEAQITFDAAGPLMAAADAAVTAVTSADSITLEYTQAASDAASGVDSYVVVGRMGRSAPPKCSGSSAARGGGLVRQQELIAPDATAGSTRGAAAPRARVSFGGLQPGQYAFRVCAKDAAGNVGAGVAFVTSIA